MKTLVVKWKRVIIGLPNVKNVIHSHLNGLFLSTANIRFEVKMNENSKELINWLQPTNGIEAKEHDTFGRSNWHAFNICSCLTSHFCLHFIENVAHRHLFLGGRDFRLVGNLVAKSISPISHWKIGSHVIWYLRIWPMNLIYSTHFKQGQNIQHLSQTHKISHYAIMNLDHNFPFHMALSHICHFVRKLYLDR